MQLTMKSTYLAKGLGSLQPLCSPKYVSTKTRILVYYEAGQHIFKEQNKWSNVQVVFLTHHKVVNGV